MRTRERLGSDVRGHERAPGVADGEILSHELSDGRYVEGDGEAGEGEVEAGREEEEDVGQDDEAPVRRGRSRGDRVDGRRGAPFAGDRVGERVERAGVGAPWTRPCPCSA